MKRTPFKPRTKGLKRGTKLRVAGKSDVSETKREIQDTARAIVIKRDKGCILNSKPDIPDCNGYRKDGELILQADHLITRANSATYADTRLIVCVCKGHHGWKKWNEQRYNEIVRQLISPERVALWDRCHADRYKPVRTTAYDWQLALIALKDELKRLS